MAFEFLAGLDSAVSCNCSYCTRKAAMHLRVGADRFRLLQGEAALSLYRFGTLRARHHFCSHCGIHTHCRPRSAPEQVNVNLHCLEDPALRPATVRRFDGRSWSTE